MSDTSGRHRLLALWFFLTVAGVGLALIASSLWLQAPMLLPIGTAVLASGGFCFLVIQFWVTGTRPLSSAPQPIQGRSIDFTYANPVPAVVPRLDKNPDGMDPQRHHAPTRAFTEELVEFELAGPEAPTTLKLPTAFQVEVQADAEPVSPRPWIEQTISAANGASAAAEREFVPAVERRQEIVSGLPLLSQIFSEPSPSAAPTNAANERPGKTRGQCGSCGTFIWAPTQRPIRLRCPKCGHVKTLTE